MGPERARSPVRRLQLPSAGQGTDVLLKDGERLRQADAFRSRFRLTHEYRRFPFGDPDLPAQLLPHPWIGALAREAFLAYSSLLKPAAEAYYLSVAHNRG